MSLPHRWISNRALRGFTLVEILVVVVILGLAGAIVVPSLTQPTAFSIQAAGRTVISDILIAQNDAVATQLPRSVVFDGSLNRYRLLDDQGTTLQMAWRSGGTVSNYVVDFNNDTRFNGVRLEVGATGVETFTLTFNALGAPNAGGTLDLVSGNSRYRITIAPFTGRVTIAEVL